MAILCPGCWRPAAEDAMRCGRCGHDLLDQLVVLVDEPVAAFGSNGDPGLAGWRLSPRRRDRPAGMARTTTPPRSGIAASVPMGPLVVGDERIAAQTLVISRVVELAPAVGEAVLDSWWRANSSRALVEAGCCRLQLGPPVHRPGDGSLCHMSGRLRRRFGWPPVHLQLELTAWSSSRTELSLRPWRRVHNIARYFFAGQATLDRMAAELINLAAG